MKLLRLVFTHCVFALMLVPNVSSAQTITINSVSGANFCAGDPISITFTVTGTWGHKNAFTLQLSNVSGTFNNGFAGLGSVTDTVPGTFTINTAIPPTTLYSSHYRIRVIGAYPYTESADNGSDILIGQKPSHNDSTGATKLSVLETALAVGVPMEFSMFRDIGSPSADTAHIDFGPGATQSVSQFGGVSVTYNSPGLKTVVVEWVAPGGCSARDSFQVYAFGCENPVVPKDAIILSENTEYTDNQHSNKTFWLNPGVTLTLGRNMSDTIFAEAGSSVFGQNGGQTDDIVYLKRGASSDADFYGVVVYQPGSSLTNTNTGSIRTVECPDLMFDYSIAPPNPVMHINEAATPAELLPPIVVSPNPTHSIVKVEGVPLSAHLQVMNVLGVVVNEIARTMQSNFTLDLSELEAGTYYLRLVSQGGVVTKKIVKN